MKNNNKKLKNIYVRSYKSVCTILFTSLLAACGAGDYKEEADRNEVVLLGDSIFDLSGDIQRFLEADAGQTFRDYTLSGAELTGGLITSVAEQYEDAKAKDANIETILMDGGGNDILIPAMLLDPYGCRTHWWRWDISDSCKQLVDETYIDLVNLLNQMDADGVSNVLYLGYYELPRTNSNLKAAVNFGDTRLADACNNTTANCTFMDPRGMIPSNHVKYDNIHPTEEGSRTLADLIWPHLAELL